MPIIKTKLSYILKVPKIFDEGNLSYLERSTGVPFEMKRIYYIYDVIDNAVRGRHAHLQTQQILFCLRGSITIILDNGNDKEAITLKSPDEGIFLDKMMWHEMVAFKKNTILMVIASDVYKPDDYIRDYKTYLKERGL